MAEVVGLAASVAGLVALTGQIGKSILFIKGFLEDTKNAPEEIHSLAAEIELLGSAAKKTDGLLVKCNADGLDIDLEEERKGLTRYADMIERLKEKIEKDAKNFGVGRGRWWERVGSAARKKSVEGYLVGVERAKTLVIGIETKISIQLQHCHRDTLLTTNQTLETLQLSTEGNATSLNTVETQTTQITNWTGTTDRKLEALRISTEENTTTLNKVEKQTTQIKNWTGTTDQTLANLSNGVQQINTSINTLIPAMQSLQSQSSPPTELSALESMLESAVMRGLKRHSEELKKSAGHSIVHSLLPETAPGFHDTPSENTDEQLYSGSYAMIRRDETVFRTAFRTPFFDIEIETKEVQRTPKPKNGTPIHELSRFKPTLSQRFTKYSVRVKIPFWRGGMTFQSGNASMLYGGSLCRTFQTYNLVPWNAPIIKACREFNLPEVRRLFEAGLASPLDINYAFSESLVDTVLSRLSYSRMIGEQVSSAIALLKYLISCLGGDIGRTNKLSYLFFIISDDTKAQKNWSVLTEACRLVTMHSSDDPCQGIQWYFSIAVSKTPLYQVMVAQDKWWIDDSIQTEYSSAQNIWYETDLQMLKDPEALHLKAAIAKGFRYKPYLGNVYDDGTGHDCLHLLLTIAAENMEDRLHKSVLSRLVILLESGMDPRGVDFFFNWVELGRSKASMERPLSCTEYALKLGLKELWQEALEGAGWSHENIDKLFGEDLLLATASLMNGEIEYQTRDYQRRHFFDKLRQGEFVDLDGDALYTISRRWDYELGLYWVDIFDMIRDVTDVFKMLQTPGSWSDEQGVRLIPGQDFRLPFYNWGRGYEPVKNWKCIRDIWEEELGGCIPES
ncbi:hypothetical protein BKA65DRAFT_109683 [Rhexocercosporidium sp. MPI-PUGE-AT-0058]|nr:hypothetical protein BKA65DRAFT_109683 [Rhexocercosporidium sp. MPI-PUGE-AT-0058]